MAVSRSTMAETVTSNNVLNTSIELCNSHENSHVKCIYYAKFIHFGWETLYKKYMSNVIRILDVHSNICRLYLVTQLDESANILTKTLCKLEIEKHYQLPNAMQLTSTLKDILPDADPIYLDLVGEMYVFDQDGLSELIERNTTKNKSYPNLQDYNARIKSLNIINNLIDNFQVKEFLSMCPDPVNYFNNAKMNTDKTYYDASVSYLSDKFNCVSLTFLRAEFLRSKLNLTKAFESISNHKKKPYIKRVRKTLGYYYEVTYKTTENIEFLKEMAFLNHKNEILHHIEHENTNHKIEIEEAKSNGQLQTCECCYNNELLITEVHSCPAGHNFCSLCLKKGIEVAVGASKMDFKCFANCTEEFSLTMIEKIVDEKLYQRIFRYKQTQEIKDACIEGLETCAFCDYSVVLSPEYKIINCLNPDCKKETCRECREESHFPYQCDEIEKAPEVKVRTMIENKMTEVLIRMCYYCKRKFVKEDGCNKMTCSCGKQMCYICRKPVNDSYTHFYHEIVLEKKCPLYTDENIVHIAAVEAAARLIIKELKVDKPELLKNIDINKILPAIKNTTNLQYEGAKRYSAVEVNKLVALIIGQNVEDIENLQDMTMTRYGTAIDGIFTRYLDNVMSSTFVSYFSYHRPIVTLIPSIVPLEALIATIADITDETSNNVQ